MAKILILEPDDSRGTGLIDAIQEAGLLAEVVADYEEALKGFQLEPPALVVLDLSMGNGRGLDLCHAIRETPGGELVPILLLGTGQEGIKSFGDALAEGGDYYFQKPLDIQKVVSKILTYVGGDRDGPTQVGPPPAAARKAPQEPPGKGLAGRMQEMLGLGEAFKDGRILPSGEPPGAQTEEIGLEPEAPAEWETTKEVALGNLVDQEEEESQDAFLARIADELADMRKAGGREKASRVAHARQESRDVEAEIDRLGEEPVEAISLDEHQDEYERAERKTQQEPPNGSPELVGLQAAEMARREVDERLVRELAMRAEVEAEEEELRARKDAQERARREAQERAQREAEERAPERG